MSTSADLGADPDRRARGRPPPSAPLRPPVVRGLLLCLAGLALTACSDATAPAEQEEDDGTDEPVPVEVTLQYVQRLPVLEWVWGSPDPTREGWPEPGQEVTWRLHMRNWATEELEVELLWRLDGAEVKRETVTLPADAVGTADLPWTWTFERHRLEVVLDPDDVLDEESESNNRLEVFTDALSVGFWAEESYYDFYREHLGTVNGARNSLEDQLQFWMKRLNLLFENAVYEETPEGVLDRVRIDRIEVVEDGFLEGRHANYADRTVDLQWAYPSDEIQYLRNDDGFTRGFEDNSTLLHELGHARGLTDVYQWDVFHDRSHGGLRAFVAIEEDGEPIVGSPYMPVLSELQRGGSILYRTPEKGLMNEDYSYVDRYSAIVLNRRAGWRARLGSWNCPEDCGFSMADLPAENRLTLVDASGELLTGARVEVYQAEFRPDWPEPGRITQEYYDDEPDMVLEADATGSVLLGRNPFGESYEGREPLLPQRHVVVRAEKDGRVGYAFLESRLFNLAYWAGDTELAEHTLEIELIG